MQARDIMTKLVVTATPDTLVGEIVNLMIGNHISAGSKVDRGWLAGIVSRANLLQGLASVPLKTVDPDVGSRALRDAVVAALQDIPNFLPVHINVTVQDGDAKIRGVANSNAEEAAVRVAE